jgi:amino acid transporter
VICTILYILVAVTLTGVVHYTELGVPAPIAVGIDRIVELRGWPDSLARDLHRRSSSSARSRASRA